MFDWTTNRRQWTMDMDLLDNLSCGDVERRSKLEEIFVEAQKSGHNGNDLLRAFLIDKHGEDASTEETEHWLDVLILRHSLLGFSASRVVKTLIENYG